MARFAIGIRYTDREETHRPADRESATNVAACHRGEKSTNLPGETHDNTFSLHGEGFRQIGTGTRPHPAGALIDEFAMTTHYRLLAINAAMTRQEDWMKREEQKDSYTINVDAGIAYLRGRLRILLREGYTFDDVVFTTHGNKGRIFFGNEVIHSDDWYNPDWYAAGYDRLFPGRHTRIYFTGCNVAESELGWKFLEGAVRSLCQNTGGVSLGWTSAGFNWLPSGHVKHLWGSTREVMLVGGDALQFYENWNRVDDGINRPT